MTPAHVQHGTGLADRLRPGLAASPGRTRLAAGGEEEPAVHAAAGALGLPVPYIRIRAWKPAGIRHRDRLLVGTAVAPILHSVQYTTLEPRQYLFKSDRLIGWVNSADRHHPVDTACSSIQLPDTPCHPTMGVWRRRSPIQRREPWISRLGPLSWPNPLHQRFRSRPWPGASASPRRPCAPGIAGTASVRAGTPPAGTAATPRRTSPG